MSVCRVGWCNALTSEGSHWCAQHRDDNEQQVFTFSQDMPLESAWTILKFVPAMDQYRGISQGVLSQHAARRGPSGALAPTTMLGPHTGGQQEKQPDGQPPPVMPGHQPNCNCGQCLQLQAQGGQFGPQVPGTAGGHLDTQMDNTFQFQPPNTGSIGVSPHA